MSPIVPSIVPSLAGAAFGALVLLSAEAASAASPAYCALYAREYANQFEVQAVSPDATALLVQDQAYYRCLNLDEDPEFPATSAYFGADFEAILSGEAAATVVSEGDTSAAEIIEPPAEPEVVEKPKRVASASVPRRPGRGSGYDPWTPEWFDWCEAHYRSFDPETGYVKTYAGVRKLCP